MLPLVKKISAVAAIAVVSLSPSLAGAGQVHVVLHPHHVVAHVPHKQAPVVVMQTVSSHVAVRVLTPIHVPKEYRTSGASVAYPDATDPTRTLPRIDQLAFACIRYHESRNKLNDGGGSQGWYQFTQSTWNSAATVLHLPLWTATWSPNRASGNMQSEVAVWYFKRNGRFGVQWMAEAGDCPGVFTFN